MGGCHAPSEGRTAAARRGSDRRPRAGRYRRIGGRRSSGGTDWELCGLETSSGSPPQSSSPRLNHSAPPLLLAARHRPPPWSPDGYPHELEWVTTHGFNPWKPKERGPSQPANARTQPAPNPFKSWTRLSNVKVTSEAKSYQPVENDMIVNFLPTTTVKKLKEYSDDIPRLTEYNFTSFQPDYTVSKSFIPDTKDSTPFTARDMKVTV
ncbi:hypothetical protein EJB05_58068, partial [Eragrostis curvula]